MKRVYDISGDVQIPFAGQKIPGKEITDCSFVRFCNGHSMVHKIPSNWMCFNKNPVK